MWFGYGGEQVDGEVQTPNKLDKDVPVGGRVANIPQAACHQWFAVGVLVKSLLLIIPRSASVSQRGWANSRSTVAGVNVTTSTIPQRLVECAGPSLPRPWDRWVLAPALAALAPCPAYACVCRWDNLSPENRDPRPLATQGLQTPEADKCDMMRPK